MLGPFNVFIHVVRVYFWPRATHAHDGYDIRYENGSDLEDEEGSERKSHTHS